MSTRYYITPRVNTIKLPSRSLTADSLIYTVLHPIIKVLKIIIA